MNAEYERLEAEARDAEKQMRELAGATDLKSAATLVEFETQVADLGSVGLLCRE